MTPVIRTAGVRIQVGESIRLHYELDRGQVVSSRMDTHSGGASGSVSQLELGPDSNGPVVPNLLSGR